MIDETDLVRLVDGSCSPETAIEIQNWVAADPRRAELLDELRDVWRLAGETSARWDLPAARARLESARANLAARNRRSETALSASPGVVPPKGIRSARGSSPWPTFAARHVAFAVAAVTIAVTATLLAKRETPITYRDFTTASGARAQLTLPDGSQVHLGSATRLRLPSNYGGTSREVELDGEGYFTVTHDASRPFRVRSAQGVAEDLGTRFDVRDYGAKPGEYRLLVAEGSVALRTRRAGDSGILTLRAGDRAVIDAKGAPAVSSGVPVERELAWTRGRLEFDDAPVDSVIAELARWYEVKVTLRDRSLHEERVTVALTITSVDEALSTLARVLHLQVARAGSVVELTSADRAR